MAKVAFSKLKLAKKNEVVKVKLTDEIEVEVLQYLPVDDKLKLIAAVLNNTADDNNFANPVKVEIIGSIEIIKAYTNLNFTEKQLEDPAKLYDLLEQNNIINIIIGAIPSQEYQFVLNGINETIEAYYKFTNSALGILTLMGQDYNNLDLDASAIQEKIGNPDNLKFLKEVLTKLG